MGTHILRFVLTACIAVGLFGANLAPVQAQSLSDELSAGGASYSAYLPFAFGTSDQFIGGFPTLQQFVQSVQNGNPADLVGAYAPQMLANPIVRQPEGNPSYISSAPTELTEFSLAAQQGVTGILAHNTLAGSHFFEITLGQEITLVYGNGSTRAYQVVEISRYQALNPTSPTTNFIDLQDNTELTAAELFARYYMGEHHITLQTCITNAGILSWGRLFLVAVPLP